MRSFTGKNNQGLSIVELIIASAVILIIFLALITVTNLYYTTSFDSLRDTEAVYLAEEGMEAVRYLKTASFSNVSSLSTTTTYYIAWSGSSYGATTTASLINNFYRRTLTISDVKRDANSDIAIGGTFDPNTKKVTVSVAYLKNKATTTRTLTSYVTNFN